MDKIEFEKFLYAEFDDEEFTKILKKLEAYKMFNGHVMENDIELDR